MKREKYAVFTIDVEDFADTECVAKSGQRVRRHMLDGLDIYIRLLEQYQIRATMFAVCRTALREQERVQRYVDRGHRSRASSSLRRPFTRRSAAIARRASDWTRKSSILCGSLASATIRAGWTSRPRAM